MCRACSGAGSGQGLPSSFGEKHYGKRQLTDLSACSASSLALYLKEKKESSYKRVTQAFEIRKGRTAETHSGNSLWGPQPHPAASQAAGTQHPPMLRGHPRRKAPSRPAPGSPCPRQHLTGELAPDAGADGRPKQHQCGSRPQQLQLRHDSAVSSLQHSPESNP